MLTNMKVSVAAKLEGDPDWFDAKLAGRWCWAICCKLGGGFCSGEGPWQVIDGELVKVEKTERKRLGQGVSRSVPCMSSEQGVRGLRSKGVSRSLPCMINRGVVKGSVQRRRLKSRPLDVSPKIVEWMNRLAERLRNVRVLCGDWSRAMTPAVTFGLGLTGICADPPYGEEADRCGDLYAQEDLQVAKKVRKWCLENGDNPKLRIALCGYAAEHKVLEENGWDVLHYSVAGGYGNQGQANKVKGNRFKETVWFSPHCLPPRGLFNDI